MTHTYIIYKFVIIQVWHIKINRIEYLYLQISGDDASDVNGQENCVINENGLIDIDKLSPINGTPSKKCNREDGDGAIWQKIHAEDSML